MSRIFEAMEYAARQRAARPNPKTLIAAPSAATLAGPPSSDPPAPPSGDLPAPPASVIPVVAPPVPAGTSADGHLPFTDTGDDLIRLDQHLAPWLAVTTRAPLLRHEPGGAGPPVPLETRAKPAPVACDPPLDEVDEEMARLEQRLAAWPRVPAASPEPLAGSVAPPPADADLPEVDPEEEIRRLRQRLMTRVPERGSRVSRIGGLLRSFRTPAGEADIDWYRRAQIRWLVIEVALFGGLAVAAVVILALF